MPPVSTVETPKALPQLTRTVALELLAVRKARTKRVGGANLTASCFAYIGDLARTATWLLAIRVFGDVEKTKALIRKAIVAFDQTEIPDAKQKARAWRRLVAAASRHGIQIASEQKSAPMAEVAAFRAAAEAEDDPEDPDYDEEDGEEERDADVFEMSFSSDTPVPRWFGLEILDHSSGAIDLTRAENGLAYLVDHATRDQVGIIENFRIENGKSRGDVRFSRSQRGQDIKRDVEDGIRRFTSIGYMVNEMVLEKETEDENGSQRTYRVTKWTPMEGSTVAVPADYSVGAGRAADQKEFPVSVRSAVSGTPAPARPAQSTSVEVRKMDPKHVQEIIALCNTHGIDAKRQSELFAMENLTVDMASRAILADVAKRDGKQISTPSAETSGNMLELTEREQRNYMLLRGVNAKIKEAETGKRDNCMELEISDEIEKRYDGKKHGGVFVPFRLSVDPESARKGAELAKRAASTLTAQTATKGAEVVFTEPGEFIQFLYNQMRLKELGAQVLSGLQGNIAFPKQTGKASGSWVAENPGADVADSNLTLSQVLMSPHTYQSSASYSRQLLAQAVIDIDNLVRQDLARDVALALDSAGINGTGASNDPKGILHTTGVQAYTVVADSGNGGKPTWDDVTLMEEALEDVNADQVGDFGWLTTPGVKGLFKRTPRLLYAPAGGTVVNVTGDPIWTDDSEIDGLMARSSNQVPKGLTIGTSHAAHALIVGVFSSMINGLWGSGFELVVDPYRLKKQGLIELTTFILSDWALRYPVGFAAAVDCLTS